jgi:hypothetical protein
LHAADNAVGVRAFRAAQLFDRLRHRWDGMLPQQFQYAHELADSVTRTVPIFQPRSQFAERRREFPIAVHIRVVQGRRASGEGHQIMQRIENLVARFIAPLVRGHDLIVMDDVHSIDVAFDRHGLEGRLAGDAVADVVETGELILIDFRRFADAGIETMPWQFGCLFPIATVLLINGFLRIA